MGEYLARALLHPLNILPAAGMLAVGVAFNLWIFYVTAIGWYVLATRQTLRDPNTARKALGIDRRRALPADGGDATIEARLHDAEVRRRYREALAEKARLDAALESSPVPAPEVTHELVGLVADMGTLCLQAQHLSDYLDTVDVAAIRQRRDEVVRRAQSATGELAQSLQRTRAALDDQLASSRALQERREQFTAEMLALVSTLGAIRADLVRMSLSSEDDAAARLREQVGGARLQVRATSDLFAEYERGLPDGA